VLPFTKLSNYSGQQCFANGITEDLAVTEFASPPT
jgi:TolB-like protein